MGSPREAKIKPYSVSDAQFSLQYTVAAALIRGDFFLKELEPESIQNDEIIDLARRVYVEADNSLRTDTVLGRTVMEIEREGKSSVKEEIELLLGSPSRPVKYEKCAEKFLKSASYSVRKLEKRRLEELIDIVSRLEELPDVSIILPYLF